MRSRLIAVPPLQGSLRLRLVRGAANEPVIELSSLIRADRQDGALQVMEGGRSYVGLDELDELVNALQAIRAEHHAAEASALRAPRLRTMPAAPPPMRPTSKRAFAGDEGEF